MVGTWVETKDGKILEVIKETSDYIVGVEVEYNTFFPLRYGRELTVKKGELI